MLQRIRQSEAWPRWAALTLALLFFAVFLWLINRQYLTFQLWAPDVERFDQSIWNTLRGRFLFNTINNKSLLEYHFSPYMALLSPLLLIWSDVRILFIAQLASIAVAGLILYLIVEDKHPGLAPWFLLAFFLNPALHQVTLLELRRVTLAMPFLALMLYGLYKDRRGLMLIGIVFALLAKENIGLIVAMVGLYLLIFKRDWKWGIPITVLGAAWTAGMLLWVIPSLAGKDGYPQANYFAAWGNSIGEIVRNMISNPLQVMQVMFEQTRLAALWRVLLPLAIVLPFLAADYLVIAVPLVVMMLLSSEPAMHELERWYMAPVLPVLFAALAVALGRLPRRLARWSIVALLAATLIAYGLYSQAPLGRRFQPHRYELTERHQRAWEVIRAVPDDAKVAAQAALVTPLAHREHIYIYPWIALGEENIDYFVVGRGFNAYPIPADEIDWEITNLVSDPDNVVEMEVDGIYLLHQGGDPQPAIDVNRVAEGAIKLDRVEVAVADERGYYRTVEGEPLAVSPGDTLRVTLYWEALAAPNAERTVSVRLEDQSGALVAQHDMLPVNSSRPTSWWQPGWRLRDVYYLTVAPEVTYGPASLDLVLYDSFTLERVPFEEDEDTLHLLNVKLVEQATDDIAMDRS